MYTKCPECKIAFRVTAKVLQQANGNVRCGSCAHSFNALKFLTEDAPASSRGNTENTSRQHLEILDKLAGSDDVLIEDTGVEWRVLDEVDANGDSSNERRYDDNTPLPDDVDNEGEDRYSPLTPQPRTADRLHNDAIDLAEPQGDLALSEPDDWTGLLDEVGNPEPDSLEVEEELAAIHSQLSAREVPATSESTPVDLDAQFDVQAEAMGLEMPKSENAMTDEVPLPDDIRIAAEDSNENDTTADAHVVPPLTETEMTVNMEIDQEMMAIAAQDDEFSATLVGIENAEQLFDDNADEVETIIMEGESIRDAIEELEITGKSLRDDPVDPAGTYTLTREKLRGGSRKSDPPGYGVVAAVVLLTATLAAQYVHHSRESLATLGIFNRTVAPVYRMLGNPVTPEWNVKGWQFEATNGSVAENEATLTIVSRLINRARQPLPYPLVHVSLTDRWEDIMGSRILEPRDYLAGDLDPSKPVQPGEKFTAVITIEEPDAEATGFKLNVCYRVGPGTVRCAIEDFKN